MFSSALMVRDAAGNYSEATPDQIIDAARFVIETKAKRGQKFSRPSEVREYFAIKLGGLEREVFSVIFLDHRHQLIEYAEMFQGTLNEAQVYMREVARKALQLNASAVIVSHNHPSADPAPSSADVVMTKRLREVLELVDVRLLDHIVVGGNRTVSMAESGHF
ncbi:JAB domain-containing protein [Xanthomonas oryzae]